MNTKTSKNLTSEQLIALVDSLYGILDDYGTLFFPSLEEEDISPNTLVFRSYSHSGDGETLIVSTENATVRKGLLGLEKEDGEIEDFTMLKVHIEN